MVKKAGKRDKDGHNFIIFSQATGQTWYHISAYITYPPLNHSHKGCPSRESRKPTCANCNGPHVASYKGCPEHKRQAFRQHMVNNRKTYACVVSQNILPQPQKPQTFNFTAEQLTKFIGDVVIQIAQPQVCYPNPTSTNVSKLIQALQEVF